MAGPNTQMHIPGLEYLRDATVFQMEKVNEFDSPPPCKIFKIVSTNSVSYCCTVPNSNDLVIKDEKHGNNRFCINGVNLPIATLYCSANKPFGWRIMGTESIRVTDDVPKSDWVWKLSIRHARIHPNRKYISTVIWNDSREQCASITVEASRITWDMHPSLSPVLKALLLAQGISWAVLDPNFQREANQPPPCGIDSLLWVDYTERLRPDEEGVPINTLKLKGREFRIWPYLNSNEDSSYYGFTLSDEAHNVLMMLKFSTHLKGDLKGTLTGFTIDYYGIFKCNGMHKDEKFLNVRCGPLGLRVGVVQPAFTNNNKGWNLVDDLEDDCSPNKNLYTDGKFEQWAYRITNSLGELVCTYRTRKGDLKIELERDMRTETKLILVSYAVKIACLWAKLHTDEHTPIIRNIYSLKFPRHLVRTNTGRKADFQSVFTTFSGIKSVFIRGAFKIADEDSIFLHLLDPQSKEVIYTVRSEVGAVENYLLPFRAEIMDDEGNLVLFAHQPATVPTLMINQKEGNNIGYYEHGQCEADHCESYLQTDDGVTYGIYFGTVKRVRNPQLYLQVMNRCNIKIAGMYSPCPGVTELRIHSELTCDQIMVIVAAAIRESLYMFHIHQDLPIFPTLVN